MLNRSIYRAKKQPRKGEAGMFPKTSPASRKIHRIIFPIRKY